MYNIFNVRRNEWEIGRLNLRDAATERRTTIPYREEISHSAMSGSFSFVDQIYKMKEIKEFKIIPLNQILLDSSEENNIPDSEVESIIGDIKEKGLIRPVIVYTKSNNEYALVLGKRRFFATKIIGHESIFCGIIEDEVTREEAAAISLCYTSLEGMLSHEDKNSAIKFLLDDNDGDIDKISSLTDISEANLKAYIDA